MSYDGLLSFLSEYYLWLKAAHILAIIAWMAGLLYLPRLFVYHHEYKPNEAPYWTFVTMERRLLNIIMNPAMITSFVLGGLLTLLVWDISGGWLHAKLLLVVLLAGFQGFLSRQHKLFARGLPPYDEKFFRIVNEVPFAFAILIVILVVVKPF